MTSSSSPKSVSGTQPAETQEVNHLIGGTLHGANTPGARRGFNSSGEASTDPKTPKRYRASQAEWSAIHELFADDRCWVCNAIWTELHHILNRSHSGDDVVVNLAPLCSDCHRKVEARDPLARSLVRQSLMPSNIQYLRYRLGDGVEAWLERNYPTGLVAA